MSILRIEYDPARSGFMFMVGGSDRQQPFPSKWDGVQIYKGHSGRFAALESNRRLPVRKLHTAEFTGKAPPAHWQRYIPERIRARPQPLLHEPITPWNEFFQTLPQGDFAVNGDSFRVNAFHMRQTSEELSAWFSEGDDVPRDNWVREEEPDYGITLWFTSRTVPQTPLQMERGIPPCRLLAGMRIKLACSEAQYPVTRLVLELMDFK